MSGLSDAVAERLDLQVPEGWSRSRRLSAEPTRPQRTRRSTNEPACIAALPSAAIDKPCSRRRIIGSTSHGTRRIRTPLRPRPREQRRLVSQRGERGQRDGGGDTRAAVGTESAIARDAVAGQQLVQLVRTEKRAVVGERLSAGQVLRTGDVTGNPIDRLNVAAEAFRCARVEQRQV